MSYVNVLTFHTYFTYCILKHQFLFSNEETQQIRQVSHMLDKLRVEEGEVVEKVRVDIHDDDLLRRSQVGGHGSKLGVKVRNVFMMFLLTRERLD